MEEKEKKYSKPVLEFLDASETQTGEFTIPDEVEYSEGPKAGDPYGGPS